ILEPLTAGPADLSHPPPACRLSRDRVSEAGAARIFARPVDPYGTRVLRNRQKMPMPPSPGVRKSRHVKLHHRSPSEMCSENRAAGGQSAESSPSFLHPLGYLHSEKVQRPLASFISRIGF